LGKSISAECADPHALSNKKKLTALSFQMAELSIIEYDIFTFFPTPPHLEPETEMKLVEFFIRFGFPDY
jgi:hypothetical protein